MTDTNDMRRDFEALARMHNLDLTPDKRNDGFYKASKTDYVWIFWQAATERATAIERERCAVVCELLKEGALSIQTGPTDDLSNVMIRQVAHLGAGACAEAIRLGGAHD